MNKKLFKLSLVALSAICFSAQADTEPPDINKVLLNCKIGLLNNPNKVVGMSGEKLKIFDKNPNDTSQNIHLVYSGVAANLPLLKPKNKWRMVRIDNVCASWNALYAPTIKCNDTQTRYTDRDFHFSRKYPDGGVVIFGYSHPTLTQEISVLSYFQNPYNIHVNYSEPTQVSGSSAVFTIYGCTNRVGTPVSPTDYSDPL